MVGNKGHTVAVHECIDTHVFSFEETCTVLERVICSVFLVEGMNKACDEVYGYMGQFRVVDYLGYLDPFSLRYHRVGWTACLAFVLAYTGSIMDGGICTASIFHSVL